MAALEGSWTVAQAAVNGVARADGKLLNATWTFRGTELVVQSVPGERLRAAVSFDATAEPPAFHVTPLDPSGERPLWIIWARQGDELRLAFYDGVDRRPEDFGPRRKLVVLTLAPTRATPTSAALDPCNILRGAGVDRLLGGPTQARPAPYHADGEAGGPPPGSLRFGRDGGLLAPAGDRYGMRHIDVSRKRSRYLTSGPKAYQTVAITDDATAFAMVSPSASEGRLSYAVEVWRIARP